MYFQVNIQTTEGPSSSQPQVASPSLRPCRPQTDPASDVEPHLHLMCDLLPCSHRGQFEQHTSDYTSERKSEGDNRAVIEKGDNSCDKEERQYKQFLEAEKPDIDTKKANVDTGDILNNSAIGELKHKHRDLEEMVQDIVINRDNTEDDEVVSVHSDKSESDKDRKIRKENSKSRNSEKSDNHKQKQSVNDDYVTLQRNEIELLEKHKDREVTDSKHEKIIKPKHSSSPNLERKGVSAAIGQVGESSNKCFTTNLVL